MESIDKDNLTSSKFDSKRKAKMNLFYQRLWSDSLVVFTVRSQMADSNCQTDERGDRNLQEKVEERKK